jgi:hypothetical protein
MILLNQYKIAQNESEFISGLFCKTGTADGVIIKTNKRSVKFKLFDHTFIINKYGCICLASDNGNFYPSSFSKYLDNIPCMILNAFVEKLTLSKNYNGRDTIYNFKG